MLGRQSAARQDESPVTFGNRDRQARRHHRATTAGAKHARFDGHQIASRVAVVGVDGQRRVGVKALERGFP